MTKTNQTKLFVDQYGQNYFAKNLKELKSKVCPYLKAPKTSKMYQDKKDGTVVFVGYVISNYWLTCYLPLEINA